MALKPSVKVQKGQHQGLHLELVVRKLNLEAKYDGTRSKAWDAVGEFHQKMEKCTAAELACVMLEVTRKEQENMKKSYEMVLKEVDDDVDSVSDRLPSVGCHRKKKKKLISEVPVEIRRSPDLVTDLFEGKSRQQNTSGLIWHVWHVW
eukprot:Sspe_Gene.27765::Locus_12137_Transcript_1_1_Confidence_1.000_Length_746::g.27765::m.27765